MVIVASSAEIKYILELVDVQADLGEIRGIRINSLSIQNFIP